MLKTSEPFTTKLGQHIVILRECPETQARSIMRKLKPVMDPELIWFAYYNEEPVGFFIGLPELNQVFKYINGNLNWWGKLKFLLHKKRGACNNVFGTAFGIVPEHQKKGWKAQSL